jgi:hypothetical protein
MRAISADGENFFSLAHDQNRLAARVAENAGAIIQLPIRNSFGEIRSA